MWHKDFATVFNFDVEIIGRRRIYRSSFNAVSGLKAQGNVTTINEGGKNDRPHTHVKGIAYQPITLSRGMTDELDLVIFFSNQWDPRLGLTHHFQGKPDDNFFTMRVSKKDRSGNVLRVTEYRRCQVIGYEEGDSDAMNSAHMIESVTIDFDEVSIEKGEVAGSSSNAVGSGGIRNPLG